MTVPDARTHFHRIAQQFDDLYEAENRGPARRWLDARLRASVYRRFELTFERLGDLQGRSVLDVGCGGGRYSVTAWQLGAERVVGVDFAGNMIELARTLARESGAPPERVQFECGDFTELSFEKPFDCAIVMGVFDYVADPAAFLRRLGSVVSGRIVASFPVRWSVWTPQRKLRYRLFRKCPLYFYSRGQLESLLAEVGFRSSRIEGAHRDYVVVIDR
jgi:2-polyprenyl-3-methyl-5-hydroxy-6-metoxy-1,4-benzoquinol methylase